MTWVPFGSVLPPVVESPNSPMMTGTVPSALVMVWAAAMPSPWLTDPSRSAVTVA
jgi:hypothetical protein